MAWRRIAVAALLAAIVIAAYLPVLRNGFTGYDDPDYITANPHVTSGWNGSNAAWAFRAAHAGNWHPLTWMSHMADVSMFGLAPEGHHLMSLLLHAANTLLLFFWLSGTTGAMGRSAFVALLFGVHPVHVESVAWAAERKDVLSALFLMLTLMAYTAYVKKPGIARYALVAALFAAGLMAKPMLVTLPLLLLALDWWPLRRRPALREKLPLLVLSLLSGTVTMWAQQRGGTVAALDQLPLTMRLANAALSYVRYLGLTFWPVRLSVFYPFPNAIPWWLAAGSLMLLAAVTTVVLRLRAERPWLIAGWFWYFVSLLPVIGIVQVGMQAMADRYLYIPLLGLLLIVGWEAHELLPLHVSVSAGALAAAACAVLTWNQAQVWKSGATLFADAIAVTENNFLAHDNLGVELDRMGRPEEALAHYAEAVRIRPGDRNAERNYANASFAAGERLFNQGKLDESYAFFQSGLRHQPQQALAHTYVGLILTQRHDLGAAIRELRLAIAIDPQLARAQMGLGVALAWSQQPIEAEKAFRTSLRLDPSNVEGYYDLGLVEMVLGNSRAATQSFDAALRLRPDYAPAREARAELLRSGGR